MFIHTSLININANILISKQIQNMTDQQTEICDNCLKPVPESKIATHFGYCRRNIKKCATCGQMYDINFTEDHQEEYHKMNPCRHCKSTFKPNEVSKHEAICPSRTQFCQYCDLNVPIKDFSHHLKDCEARTKKCDKCRKPIANKDFLVHTIQCPGFVQQPKSIVENVPKYSSYNEYTRNALNKQETNKYEYKPAHQQVKPQYGTKGLKSIQKKNEPVYANIQNQHGYNRQIRPEQRNLVKDNGMISRQPANKNVNYSEVNKQPVSNKYSVSNGQNRGINVVNQRQKSNKNIEPNKNVEPNRNIQANKYSNPSTRTYQPGRIQSNYIVKNQVPSTKIVTGLSKPSQSTQNSKPNNPSTNIPLSHNYSKASENIRKQIPSNKEVFMKRQTQKYKEVQPIRQYEAKSNNLIKDNRNEYKPSYQAGKRPEQNNVQEIRGHHDIRRQGDRRVQQPRGYDQLKGYQGSSGSQKPTANDYHEETDNVYNPSNFGEPQQDEQLQKAIMASMGIVGNSSSTNKKVANKPQYRMDDVPADFLQKDMMNESFYDKQHAIMQQLQRNKKRR